MKIEKLTPNTDVRYTRARVGLQPTFYEWLVETYEGRDTMRGDLARDIKHDRCFPRDATTMGQVLDHLQFHRAGERVESLTKRVWKAYENA